MDWHDLHNKRSSKAIIEVVTVRTLIIAPTDQAQASTRQIEARTSFLQFLDIIHFAKKTG